MISPNTNPGASSIGILIGQPIAGAILKHGWVGVQGFTSVCLVLCALFSVAARISKVGFGLRVAA